jgi:tetratricopeptide (TPR) repeat protein
MMESLNTSHPTVLAHFNQSSMKALSSTALALILIGMVAGCSTSRTRTRIHTGPSGVQKISMPGTVIRITPDPIILEKMYDAPRLFHLAGEAERRKESALAIVLYKKLIEEFDNIDYQQVSFFNLGMLHEDKEKWAQAIGYYEQVIKLYDGMPIDEDQLYFDTFMRLGVCFAKLKRWWDAVYAFENLVSLDWIDEQDRMEIQLGKGITFEGAGETTLAESAYSRVLSLYRRLQRGLGGDKTMAAEAAFRLGEMTRKKYEAVELSYPIALLRERLETKCGFLLTAQSRYLRSIRFGDGHTMAAAGYRLGDLYEDLYQTIVSFEPPEELSEDQIALYDEEVRRKVIVLLKKAIRIYEKSLKLGKRLQSSESWLIQLERALSRMKTLYLEEEAVFKDTL